MGYNPESYSSRHATTRLVYFEHTSDPLSAIRREKRLKRLSRQRKLRLIEEMNPDMEGPVREPDVREVLVPSPSLREGRGDHAYPSIAPANKATSPNVPEIDATIRCR